MDPVKHLATALDKNLGMLTYTLADFSDADLLVRPCPGANHAAWQIGHLANSEVFVLKQFHPASTFALPAGFEEKFTPKTSSIDDPAFFPKKQQLLDTLASARSALVAWAKTLTPADLEKPTPEKLKQWEPTVGALLAALPGHVAMHVGQCQVIRRKLGKPILF